MALITLFPVCTLVDPRVWFTGTNNPTHRSARRFVGSQIFFDLHDIPPHDDWADDLVDIDELPMHAYLLALGYAQYYRRLRGWDQFDAEMVWMTGSEFFNNFGVILRTWDQTDDAVEGDFVHPPEEMFIDGNVAAVEHME